jgi:hypothetical protein
MFPRKWGRFNNQLIDSLASCGQDILIDYFYNHNDKSGCIKQEIKNNYSRGEYQKIHIAIIFALYKYNIAVAAD